MPIAPIFFMMITGAGWIYGLFFSPLVALITYIFVYFNIPTMQWWRDYVPDIRWAFISAGVLILSTIIHHSKLKRINIPGGKQALYFLLLLYGVMILTSFFSVCPEISNVKLYDFLRYIIIFYLVSIIIDELVAFELCMGAIILFCAYYGLLGEHYFTGARLDGLGLPDAQDANMLAALLLLVIPFLFSWILNGNIYQRAVALIGTPLILNLFAMCRSRGAFVGLVVLLIVMSRVLISKIGKVKSIIAFALILFSIFSLMDDQYLNRLAGLRQDQKDHNPMWENEDEDISAGRLDVWKYGFKMFEDRPLGSGGGAFMYLSSQYMPIEMLVQKSGQKASHNTYLMILIEQGFIGLFAYGLFILSVLAGTRKRNKLSIKQDINEEDKTIELYLDALQASLIGFFCASVFIDRIYFECIYIFCAFSPALYKIHMDRLNRYRSDNTNEWNHPK